MVMTPNPVLLGMDDDIHHYDKKLENQLRLLAAESFPDEALKRLAGALLA